MARTTIEQARAALNVYVKTAAQLGLDYSGFEFVKYPSGWGLERNGERLLIRGFRSLSVWYDMIDAANESLLGVLRRK